ncbi:FAD-dependent monooxygenase [Yamadazyma tenuis]|uniref:FAD/NAD(P)-binding domain-containing protein n=1 Tax=Candida tenuis (strain ATCC 10573 / BCRC 21748 / CBS 615 / JCM 9827 / NBRC 10315 / NRRL Y-1498 / VKM Y-70) TaxID=590646 RepID=G3AZC3_CANTC|nr:FAD/NAD(P)-binding domain-containing protein [Yamadazyma tenuis ATCC 10573]XP_006684872.1 uncharacterized protein CANTEDRAFT_112921 [Yamadazyma tenuis ATCC 10573]EGV66297.1 FAD/NAD(P)-binding domain-containing protein [Yamadazyma tenuis ATCC 10573]EGV66298.1 hypothetical protein CANTEDRAFT_112921 [Yamadazyma tenuis ATCC 10573]WEJ95595.1 FAD-dependent monooxygenase [Yamadazyma tenuis]
MTTTYTLSRESHKDPNTFRIKYKDAKLVLDDREQSKWYIDKSIPVKETSSKVAIIGGGFSGIGAAMTTINKLGESDLVLFEKHESLGGTWFANTYPGCASDIPALWYSYTSELVSNWSELRPPQYEMLEYIRRVVDRYQLNSKARLKSQIQQATFNEKTNHWEIEGFNLATGERFKHTAQIICNCSGGLVVPNKFAPKGMETFKGDYMHSGIWDWSVDFKGKKVVVIGNGCSAAQVVPELLKFEPESVVQLVRSQHYILPPHPRFLLYLYNLLSRWGFGLLLLRWIVMIVAESRYPMYKDTGLVGRFVRWWNTRNSVRYMRKTVPKKFHDVLIPKYKIGCKRLIFDYVYCPTLHDPRIDVKAEQVVEVKEHSVILTDGSEIQADIIVACTGYDLNKGAAPYKLIGRNGNDVSKYWKENGPSAYETFLAKDLPNLFLIAGPNSASGHSSVVQAIEISCGYYAKVAKKILDGTYASICVKDEKYLEWFETTQKLLKQSVFGTAYGGCVSWYSDAKVNFAAYPYSQITYFRRGRNVKWDDLDLVKTKNS